MGIVSEQAKRCWSARTSSSSSSSRTTIVPSESQSLPDRQPFNKRVETISGRTVHSKDGTAIQELLDFTFSTPTKISCVTPKPSFLSNHADVSEPIIDTLKDVRHIQEPEEPDGCLISNSSRSFDVSLSDPPSDLLSPAICFQKRTSFIKKRILSESEQLSPQSLRFIDSNKSMHPSFSDDKNNLNLQSMGNLNELTTRHHRIDDSTDHSDPVDVHQVHSTTCSMTDLHNEESSSTQDSTIHRHRRLRKRFIDSPPFSLQSHTFSFTDDHENSTKQGSSDIAFNYLIQQAASCNHSRNKQQSPQKGIIDVSVNSPTKSLPTTEIYTHRMFNHPFQTNNGHDKAHTSLVHHITHDQSCVCLSKKKITLFSPLAVQPLYTQIEAETTLSHLSNSPNQNIESDSCSVQSCKKTSFVCTIPSSIQNVKETTLNHNVNDMRVNHHEITDCLNNQQLQPSKYHLTEIPDPLALYHTFSDLEDRSPSIIFEKDFDSHCLSSSSSSSSTQSDCLMSTIQEHHQESTPLVTTSDSLLLTTCAICLIDIGEMKEIGRIQICSHLFCFECILKWSSITNRCPLCKQQFQFISKWDRSLDTGKEILLSTVPVENRQMTYQDSSDEPMNNDIIDDYQCQICEEGNNEDVLLLCDGCDDAYHTYCVGLTCIPEGSWYCRVCRPNQIEQNHLGRQIMRDALQFWSVGSSNHIEQPSTYHHTTPNLRPRRHQSSRQSHGLQHAPPTRRHTRSMNLQQQQHCLRHFTNDQLSQCQTITDLNPLTTHPHRTSEDTLHDDHDDDDDDDDDFMLRRHRLRRRRLSFNEDSQQDLHNIDNEPFIMTRRQYYRRQQHNELYDTLKNNHVAHSATTRLYSLRRGMNGGDQGQSRLTEHHTTRIREFMYTMDDNENKRHYRRLKRGDHETKSDSQSSEECHLSKEIHDLSHNELQDYCQNRTRRLRRVIPLETSPTMTLTKQTSTTQRSQFKSLESHSSERLSRKSSLENRIRLRWKNGRSSHEQHSTV